jgi:predicted nucleic acid-binding protein
MEIAVRPLQLGRDEVADEYETLLAAFPNLSIVQADRAVARRAAQLRAAFRLRPADAIQVAACVEHGASAFVTNDNGLRRVDLLEVAVLDDYLEIAGDLM